jgi:hypothetical protein
MNAISHLVGFSVGKGSRDVAVVLQATEKQKKEHPPRRLVKTATFGSKRQIGTCFVIDWNLCLVAGLI